MGERKGCFIVMEGLDGAGKTTALHYLKCLLEEYDIQHVVTREPGGTMLAEELRKVLFSGLGKDANELTQAMLVNAARHDHISKVILPSLDNGLVVVSDRFALSTLAFQGIGHDIAETTYTAMRYCKPDYTLYLNVSIGVAKARLAEQAKENPDRLNWLDASGTEELVGRQARYEYAKKETRFVGELVEIDADRPVDVVQQFIRGWFVHEFLPAFKH